GLSAPLPPRAAAVKLAQTAYTCLRSSDGEGSGGNHFRTRCKPPPLTPPHHSATLRGRRGTPAPCSPHEPNAQPYTAGARSTHDSATPSHQVRRRHDASDFCETARYFLPSAGGAGCR